MEAQEKVFYQMGFMKSFAVVGVVILGISFHAQAKPKLAGQYVIPAGQEKVVRKMLTVPQKLMKAHDCGVKNIKIEPTSISNVFRCAQSTPRPVTLPVTLRHRTAADQKGFQVHRTAQFAVFLSSDAKSKWQVFQVLLEQIRRYEVEFKWIKASDAPVKKAKSGGTQSSK